MSGGGLDPDGLFINTIAVESQMRGHGIGWEILSRICEDADLEWMRVFPVIIFDERKQNYDEGYQTNLPDPAR